MPRKNRNIVFTAFVGSVAATLVLAIVFFFMFSLLQPEETAVSGSIEVGAPASFSDAVDLVAEGFSAYYPGAGIAVREEEGNRLVAAFAASGIQGVLLGGPLSEEERNWLSHKRILFSEEVVGRDAAVFVVNVSHSRNVIDLQEISTVHPYVNMGALRFHRVFLGITTTGSNQLDAIPLENSRAVLERLLLDDTGIGIMPFSQCTKLLDEHGLQDRLRMLAVRDSEGGTVIVPSRETVFDGSYPLSYAVTYLYDRNSPLAAGFGAWLYRQGQKGFARSNLVPAREPSRIIKLN